MTGRVRWGVLGLVVACKPAPVSPPAPTPVVSVAAPIEAAPGPPAADLATRLCGAPQVCRIRRLRAAGSDREGRTLTVASVDRGWLARGADAGVLDHRGPDGIVEKEHTDEFSPVGDGCRQIAYWLLVGDPAAPTSVAPLLELCNDGNGAAGLGEDTVWIFDNSFEHRGVGGSNWRWNVVRLVELSPLRVCMTAAGGHLASGANAEARHWDFDRFVGEVRWYSPPCDAQGLPIGGPGPSDFPYRYAALPTLTLDPAYVDGGWKHSGPGRCALALDATGNRTHILHGPPGAATDAAMRVVATPQGDGVSLFIEIADDRWIGPGARWLRDDHLELWVGDTDPNYMDHCLATDADSPRQWAIRVADGRVFAGHGKPDPAEISVERHRAGDRVRMRVHLRARPAALTVVYSDSDDGKAQERLISSSALKFGRTETLGALMPIDPKVATCRVENGELTPVLLAHTGATPLL